MSETVADVAASSLCTPVTDRGVVIPPTPDGKSASSPPKDKSADSSEVVSLGDWIDDEDDVHSRAVEAEYLRLTRDTPASHATSVSSYGRGRGRGRGYRGRGRGGGRRGRGRGRGRHSFRGGHGGHYSGGYPHSQYAPGMSPSPEEAANLMQVAMSQLPTGQPVYFQQPLPAKEPAMAGSIAAMAQSFPSPAMAAMSSGATIPIPSVPMVSATSGSAVDFAHAFGVAAANPQLGYFPGALPPTHMQTAPRMPMPGMFPYAATGLPMDSRMPMPMAPMTAATAMLAAGIGPMVGMQPTAHSPLGTAPMAAMTMPSGIGAAMAKPRPMPEMTLSSMAAGSFTPASSMSSGSGSGEVQATAVGAVTVAGTMPSPLIASAPFHADYGSAVRSSRMRSAPRMAAPPPKATAIGSVAHYATRAKQYATHNELLSERKTATAMASAIAHKPVPAIGSVRVKAPRSDLRKSHSHSPEVILKYVRNAVAKFVAYRGKMGYSKLDNELSKIESLSPGFRTTSIVEMASVAIIRQLGVEGAFKSLRSTVRGESTRTLMAGLKHVCHSLAVAKAKTEASTTSVTSVPHSHASTEGPTPEGESDDYLQQHRVEAAAIGHAYGRGMAKRSTEVVVVTYCAPSVCEYMTTCALALGSSLQTVGCALRRVCLVPETTSAVSIAPLRLVFNDIIPVPFDCGRFPLHYFVPFALTVDASHALFVAPQSVFVSKPDSWLQSLATASGERVIHCLNAADTVLLPTAKSQFKKIFKEMNACRIDANTTLRAVATQCSAKLLATSKGSERCVERVPPIASVLPTTTTPRIVSFASCKFAESVLEPTRADSALFEWAKKRVRFWLQIVERLSAAHPGVGDLVQVSRRSLAVSFGLHSAEGFSKTPVHKMYEQLTAARSMGLTVKVEESVESDRKDQAESEEMPVLRTAKRFVPRTPDSSDDE